MHWFSDLLQMAMSPSKTVRLRILIAEDYGDLATVTSLLLGHYGFEVKEVLNGALVYPTALTFRPHFILMDIRLPGLDGFKAAELIREDPDLKSVVIIGISAYAPYMHPDAARKAGFDYYFSKPVDFADLLPILAKRLN
ncbi:response regulator [Singulisphaera sp. PoT]|uniref:response regulator n=1 Tax=Singulisphaera sp. PoT TaxID=3411797 RepID=UPI003BF481B8